MIEVITNREILIDGKSIILDCPIEKVIEYEHLYVIMLQYDYYPGNNVLAFDASGNKKWSIEEIIHFSYSEAYVSMGKVDNELLDVITYSGVRFIFNVYSKEIISKEITK